MVEITPVFIQSYIESSGRTEWDIDDPDTGILACALKESGMDKAVVYDSCFSPGGSSIHFHSTPLPDWYLNYMDAMGFWELERSQGTTISKETALSALQAFL